MSENRVVIDLIACKASITQIDSFIRDLKLMGKYVEVETNKPEVAALVITLIGNMNKVVTVNGTVVKSFDSNYVVGEVCGWFGDFETITYDKIFITAKMQAIRLAIKEQFYYNPQTARLCTCGSGEEAYLCNGLPEEGSAYCG